MPQPYDRGVLPEDKGHTVAWAQYGNPRGAPVLFFHGGPGSGFHDFYTSLFDLERVRLITFDQRGTGQSQPVGEMRGNTTADILRDAERLRALLGLRTWAVSGHSWGASLALLYAKYARQATTQLVIASLFGARPSDQMWSFEGVARFFPDAVAALVALCPQTAEPLSLGQRMAQLMASGSEAERTELAYRMSMLGEACCKMAPAPVERSEITPEKVQKLSVLLAYAAADFFLPEGAGVFDGLEVLRDLPITLVHGRFDFDCPPETAYQLQALLPQTKLVMVQGSHSLREAAMGTAFQDAARILAERG